MRTINDVILTDIKKMLGLYEEDTSFDLVVLTHINAVFSIIKQIANFKLPDILVDETTTWDNMLNGRTDIGYISTYMNIKIKMIFDPPTSSAAAESFNAVIRELEFRISMEKEVIIDG